MKCEPLKNKKQKLKKDFLNNIGKKINEKNEFYLGFEKGIDDSFELFTSVIKLYMRYKNNVKLLMNEQKNVWLKWVEFYESQNDKNKINYLPRYNNWLFDYIFCDIKTISFDSILN